MKWLWPLSWKLRICELEMQNAALVAQNKELVHRLAGAAVAQASTIGMYITALSGMAATYSQATESLRRQP